MMQIGDNINLKDVTVIADTTNAYICIRFFTNLYNNTKIYYDISLSSLPTPIFSHHIFFLESEIRKYLPLMRAFLVQDGKV